MIHMIDYKYCQTSNIRPTLGNKIVDHSDVVGAAPTISSLSTQHLASMDWAKTTGGRLNKKDGLTRYGDSHVKDKTS